MGFRFCSFFVLVFFLAKATIPICLFALVGHTHISLSVNAWMFVFLSVRNHPYQCVLVHCELLVVASLAANRSWPRPGLAGRDHFLAKSWARCLRSSSGLAVISSGVFCSLPCRGVVDCDPLWVSSCPHRQPSSPGLVLPLMCCGCVAFVVGGIGQTQKQQKVYHRCDQVVIAIQLLQ